jgi:hypothetical protein
MRAFLDGIAKAMAVEYCAIVDAGFVLQLDDPGLPDTWDMLDPHPTLAEYTRYAMLRVEALNQALQGIPEVACAITSAGVAGTALTRPTCRCATSSASCSR